MATITQINKAPRVLSAGLQAKLQEANAAARQLRGLGCKIIQFQLGQGDAPAEIVIDRNPHLALAGFPNVHITFQVRK